MLGFFSVLNIIILSTALCLHFGFGWWTLPAVLLVLLMTPTSG